MNLPSTPDLSVYQLVLDTLASPQPFAVSPVTLKSLVGAVIDVLIEEKISATLWTKLPPTQDWQAQLQRYQQEISVSPSIYLCNCLGDDLVEETGEFGQAVDINQHTQMIPVNLAAGSQLRREYFLLVVSDQFNSVIVAEVAQPQTTEILHQSHQLMAVCSFERQGTQRVLEDIRGAIAVADTTPEELLEDLAIPCASLSACDDKALLTQLLVKQVQRTEEILHSPVTCDSLERNLAVPNASAKERWRPRCRSLRFARRQGLATLTLRHPTETAIAIPPPLNDDLRNKDELLKRVAQELRTPLTNMKTALKLLDSAQLKPAQRQRYMKLLNTQCDRQSSLIAGLLDLVQLESEPQPTVIPSVKLADIVPGVVSTYQPLAQEKGIQLGYTIPTEIPPVFCLETWLRQIIINLLHNSLKFTQAGGQVRVGVTLQGQYVQLAISDTGIGIAASEIPKIFDSFYRGRSTTNEETGAGLGLTIVQQLLLRCGGSISVTSRAGEGSHFKVLLPVSSTLFPHS